jgi:anti-anti-sigma factor
MKLIETRIGGEAAVALQGRLDGSTAVRCEAELLERVADGRKAVIIDLSGLDYIGGQGLRILVLAQRRAESLGVPFSLRNPSPPVADVLAVAGAGVLLA